MWSVQYSCKLVYMKKLEHALYGICLYTFRVKRYNVSIRLGRQTRLINLNLKRDREQKTVSKITEDFLLAFLKHFNQP